MNPIIWVLFVLLTLDAARELMATTSIPVLW
ncbi:KPN_01571 family protein [Citrobacter sp. RHB25-C09]